MSGDWIAASTRARALAARRIGAGGARAIAGLPLRSALDVVSGSLGREHEEPLPDRPAAERALAETLLWRLRVLGGWLPPAGAPLLRAAAALFERDDVVALAGRLLDGRPAPPPFELGSLSTAWPRLRGSESFESLSTELARSPWGRVDATGTAELRDQLTVAWLRRLASVAPALRAPAALAAANLAARIVLVEGLPPTPRLAQLAEPFLGTAWHDRSSLPDLVAALPRSATPLLRELAGPEELWLAEARLAARLETEALRTLRSSGAGAELVVQAIALLALDAWRTRAALADADAGAGPREVLDVVA